MKNLKLKQKPILLVNSQRNLSWSAEKTNNHAV
jgi:hypothetical protein